MSAKELKELHDKRCQLAAKIRELAEKQDDWTESDQSAWDQVNADYDDNQASLDSCQQKLRDHAARMERLSQVESSVPSDIESFIGKDVGNVSSGPTRKDFFSSIGNDGASSLTQSKAMAIALQGWMRSADPYSLGEVTDEHRQAAAMYGVNLASPYFEIRLNRNWGEAKAKANAGIRNALSGIDDPAGGYSVGETFVNNLEMAMLSYGGMFQVSEVIRTANGEPMRWPTADDTGNTGAIVGQNETVSSSTDPTFGQKLWNAYKFTSLIVKVPHELLRDSAFNMAVVLSAMLGERLGRIQNTKYTVGTGASEPYGIVPASTAGVTAASSTAITFDEVIDLEHSVDPSRRNMPGVGYMFHDNVLKLLRKLKDGNGQYLWSRGTEAGQPDMINGRMYQVNQDMASSIAASAKTMLFGQFTQYKIRQVASVRLKRLMERYADADQEGFVAFISGDGNLLNAGDNPVKHLVQA